MHLSSPKPGTIIGCLALLVAMGGTADAVTHASVGSAPTTVVFNVPARHFHANAACSGVVTGEQKLFTVAHAGFYDVDLDAATSTTAKWKLTGSGAFAGPSFSWQVDRKAVGGASALPTIKHSHLSFRRGSDVVATLLWLKAGGHVLSFHVTPYATRDNKEHCGSYTTSYTDLHARVAPAS